MLYRILTVVVGFLTILAAACAKEQAANPTPVPRENAATSEAPTATSKAPTVPPTQPPAPTQREYPSTVRETFLNACLETSGGLQEYCSCALDEVQKAYDLEEFVKLEIQMTNTGQIPEELAGPIAKCLK